MDDFFKGVDEAMTEYANEQMASDNGGDDILMAINTIEMLCTALSKPRPGYALDLTVMDPTDGQATTGEHG